MPQRQWHPQQQQWQQQIQPHIRQAAQKYGIRGSIETAARVIYEHPEVVQLIQMVAALRGNPNLAGQFQARTGQLLISSLVALDGVMEYVQHAEQAAGITPTPLFVGLHAAVDNALAAYGPQMPPTPSPTDPAAAGAGTGTDAASGSGVSSDTVVPPADPGAGTGTGGDAGYGS